MNAGKIGTAIDYYPLPQPAPLPEKVYQETTREEIAGLSLGNKLALLSLSRTTRSKALWDALRPQFEVPPYTGSNFAELRELGFADRPEGERFHRLAVKGFKAADFACDLIQAEYKIHTGYLLGNSGVNATLQCTCNWGCGIRRGVNMQANAQAAFLRHRLTVEAVDTLATALAPRGGGG